MEDREERAGTNFGGRKLRRKEGKGRGTEEEMKSRERGERERRKEGGKEVRHRGSWGSPSANS